MPKFTVLGSCKHEPYKVLAMPKKNPFWNTEKGYKIASKKFYPAIDNSDFIIVYCPYGVGKHTKKDIEYAISKGKRIIYIKYI